MELSNGFSGKTIRNSLIEKAIPKRNIQADKSLSVILTSDFVSSMHPVKMDCAIVICSKASFNVFFVIGRAIIDLL